MNITLNLCSHNCIFVVQCCCGTELDISEIYKDGDSIRCDYCHNIVGYKWDLEERGLAWVWSYIKG
jgi:hypothetical protein